MSPEASTAQLRSVYLTTRAPTRVSGTALTLNHRAAARLSVRPMLLAALARDRVMQAGLAVASPVFAHRLMTRAVAEVLGSAEPAGLARALAGSVREFLRLQLGPVRLGASGQVWPSRVLGVAQLADAYKTLLRAEGLIDGVELACVAAGISPARERLTLYGQLRLTPGELSFLDAVADEGSELYLPWENHPLFADNAAAAGWLEERGWTVFREDCPSTGLAGALLGRETAPQGELRVFAQAEEEVRGALRRVKGLLRSGVRPEDVALVVMDDDAWATQVSAVAWEYGVPIRLSVTRPLVETRVGRWLERALEATEQGLTFEPVVRMLAHPLDAGLDGEAWQRIRLQRPEGEAAWMQEGVDLGASTWPAADHRAGWVRRTRGLLDARGVSDRARERTVDTLALSYLRAELEVLATPGEETLDQASYLNELRGLLSLVAVPTEVASRGVELLTPASLFGAEVPHLIVMGALDGVLPPALKDDPALDFLERRRMRAAGLPVETAATLARRGQLDFWALLRSASGSAEFSYARHGSNEGLPSPYLQRLPLLPGVERLEACSPEEARRGALARNGPYVDATLSAARYAHGVEVGRASEQPHDRHDGLLGEAIDPETLTFSASQLSTLGRCGFSWFLGTLLRLEDQNDEARQRHHGRLTHAALETAARQAFESVAEPRTAMADAIEAALLQAEAHLEWPQTAEWQLERPELLARLRRVIAAPDFLAPEYVPFATEVNFEGSWYGLKVRGLIDRVDRKGEQLMITDYKSGTTKPQGVQDASGRLSLDLQLPIYLQAALPSLWPEFRPAGAAYFSLHGARVIDRVRLPGSELEAFVERVRAQLALGALPPRPDAAQKACKFCRFDAVCRGGARSARKVAPWA
ncbi:PD-(D/E)XK nuclease family protein [Deinococcus radiomollis]|uniref:PD-(D/E)XK nuclease family protein n=1 Tax=Deinococcus radiomollis TaxID=468916 RepID=UPI003891EB5F